MMDLFYLYSKIYDIHVAVYTFIVSQMTCATNVNNIRLVKLMYECLNKIKNHMIMVVRN